MVPCFVAAFPLEEATAEISNLVVVNHLEAFSHVAEEFVESGVQRMGLLEASRIEEDVLAYEEG